MASKVEIVVLGLLAEDPLYGYELLERYRRRGMGEWAGVGKASVYQTLRRLEEAGAVTGRQQEGTDGPDRRVYRIARRGRERLRRAVREALEAAGSYRTEAGPGLGFLHALNADEAARAIAAREEILRVRRERLAEQRRSLVQGPGPGDALAARLLELQEALAGTELAWLSSVHRHVARLRS